MTNPTKASLRDAIQKQLQALWDLSQRSVTSGTAVYEATDQIISTVIGEIEGRLPEKKKGARTNDNYAEGFVYGWNHAIDQVQSILKEMGKP